MNADTWDALALTLRIAACATLVCVPPATLLGYVLARAEFRGKELVSAAALLPMVLPPTAVGLLLLRLVADGGPLAGLDLLLTWRGAVLASAVMAFPLVVRTARATFEEIDPRLEGIARTLGLSRLRVFLRVTLPLAKRGLAAGAILGFARALGEFGATVLVAGNIPGRTRTLASAIFSAQQSGDDDAAAGLMLCAALLGLAAILCSEALVRRGRGGRSA